MRLRGKGCAEDDCGCVLRILGAPFLVGPIALATTSGPVSRSEHREPRVSP